MSVPRSRYGTGLRRPPRRGSGRARRGRGRRGPEARAGAHVLPPSEDRNTPWLIHAEERPGPPRRTDESATAWTGPAGRPTPGRMVLPAIRRDEDAVRRGQDEGGPRPLDPRHRHPAARAWAGRCDRRPSDLKSPSAVPTKTVGSAPRVAGREHRVHRHPQLAPLPAYAEVLGDEEAGLGPQPHGGSGGQDAEHGTGAFQRVTLHAALGSLPAPTPVRGFPQTGGSPREDRQRGDDGSGPVLGV